jgi:hypothetical protein
MFYVISPSAEIGYHKYMTIFKNEWIKLKNQKTGHSDWAMEHVVIFICIQMQ